MSTYYANSLRGAVRAALHQDEKLGVDFTQKSRGGRVSVYAPPLVWGRWFRLTSIINADAKQTRLKVTYKQVGDIPSRFDVEIKGGDKLIKAIGPGSFVVPVTGNVATELYTRCRGYQTGILLEVSF